MQVWGSRLSGRTRCSGGLAVLGLLLSGCSTAPASIGMAAPNHLGAGEVVASPDTPVVTDLRVTSSKVLSAIVFERVTGLEIDPARLVQP